MMKKILFFLAALLFAALPAWGAETAYPAIPPGKDNDLKLYTADGRIVKGAEALGRMSGEARFILWLAGNQFFAMDDVIQGYQQAHPGQAVGLVTLPPGLVLQAIQGGGWRYEGKDYPGLPDLYGSVNIGHLQTLKKTGLMDNYVVYMHNELQLMAAKGNPKGIRGIGDLARADVRASLPNPVNEGIMQFYLRPVLERHGLWDKIAAGKECVACQTTSNNWFTAVHHRETPERIGDGRSDAGVVWKTEVLEALRNGAPVEGITLPAQDSLRDEVSYVAGILANTPHRRAAEAYLAYLSSPAGQEAYARHGFVKASAAELAPKPIP